MARCAYTEGGTPEAPELTVSGELDMAATLQLEPVVDRLLAAGARKLTIDLGPLSFIDSTGFSLLVELTDRASREGVELRLCRPRRDVGRALEVTGLDTVLPLA